MQRLKDQYRGERAAVVLGGPSMIEQNFDVSVLGRKDFVVFLESKALTPRFLRSGVRPDFYLMLFPEKANGNGFHNFIYRAFLAGHPIKPYVRREYVPVVRDLTDNFDRYLETWRPHRGPHKRYRWRRDVSFKDSPYELLAELPSTAILANRTLLDTYFPKFSYPNAVYFFDQKERAPKFDVDEYYSVIEEDGRVILRDYGFFNSAAIALYPLLRYMGFREAYFLGMDMSMLGTMEYAAPFTFKSMWHYRLFFWNTRHVFNPSYKQNKPWFWRPQSEFEDLKKVIAPEKIELIRVYDPSRYAARVDGIHTVSTAEFLRQ